MTTSQLVVRNTYEEAEKVCRAIKLKDSTFDPNLRQVTAIKLYAPKVPT